MFGPALRRCTCREAGDRLSEYLDEELGALDRARLGLHLAACPRCAAAASALATTIRALHGLSRKGPCWPCGDC
ncbi:MAG: zf-HC2 domain-containing protein [Anaeromyxobacteraceae bacterium]|nr:zf-HC2 domain-containing protein [Anaeromyxobacteraceae bacterium]